MKQAVCQRCYYPVKSTDKHCPNCRKLLDGDDGKKKEVDDKDEDYTLN